MVEQSPVAPRADRDSRAGQFRDSSSRIPIWDAIEACSSLARCEALIRAMIRSPRNGESDVLLPPRYARETGFHLFFEFRVRGRAFGKRLEKLGRILLIVTTDSPIFGRVHVALSFCFVSY